MTLDSGGTFGSFEIVAPLGSGGMGEVYRARDPRLGREVALKVLPQGFTDDPERVARLTREARLLASLSHPNIAAIHGIEERAGALALILELVEGETLAERLRSGSIPEKSAVTLALQVAEAVEAAHARGIIHRDLKPANLKITPDGRVKVLDFGIAKALTDTPATAGIAHEPPSLATRSGTIIGTPGYMSPEQATGDTVDRRTDVWAFGCVLFEMLAGRRAFGGATPQETLARVLEHEPDWDSLPRNVSPALVHVIERCLRKDVRQRLQDIGDCRVELEDLRTGAIRPLPWRPRGRGFPRNRTVWWIAGAVALLAAGWVASTLYQGTAPLSPAQQFSIEIPRGVSLPMGTGHPVLALSPTGDVLVFVGDAAGIRRLYKRRFSAREPEVIPATEGAAAPFFSPDGKWVAFISGSMLRKVALAGGLPVDVMSVNSIDVSRGASFMTNDSIVYAGSPNSGLTSGRLSAGRVGRLTDWVQLTAEPRGRYLWPSAVDGTPFVLFADNVDDAPERARVSVFDRQRKSVTSVVTGGTTPLFSPPNRLLFIRDGTLFTSQLDLETGRIGAESRVLDSVIVEPTGASHVAVSRNGVLAYIAGPPVPRERELVWVDRRGAATTLLADDKAWSWPRISADGRRLAGTATVGSNSDVYVLSLNRLSADRITDDPGEDFGAVWNPDGSRLAFSSEQFLQDEGPHAAWQVGGSGRIELLMRSAGTLANWDFPTSWSSDGRWIAFTRERDGNADVEVIPTDKPLTSVPFAARPDAQEYGATFSPDSRFIAYVSDESGAEEVYMQSFPGTGRRVKVSTDGGTEPVWNRGGSELFYRRGNDLMSVRFEPGSRLEPRRPTVLFTGQFDPVPYGGRQANYDVSPDGSRFVFVRRRVAIRPTVIHIVMNWPVALGAPTAR